MSITADFEGFLKKNKKLIALILFVLLCAVYAETFNLGTISPGFEGAKCHFYGVMFRFNPDWEGTYKLHRYQDAEDPLVYHEDGSWEHTVSNRIYWTTVATPNDAGIGWRIEEKVYGSTVYTKEYPALGIHVESNIQLEDLTRQGDPLHWNDTDPLAGRRIEYWSKRIEKVQETEDKVVYRYVVEKESFLLAPAEFWIGFYLVPSQTDTGDTGSGWREGEWQNIVCWFRLDFQVWDNAYKDPWLDDPKQNVFTSEYEGVITSRERTYDYRGGFPIAGWIQGWEKAGWQKMAWEEGAVNNPEATNPIWLQTRGRENEIYTPEQLADLKDKLMAKVQFAPSLIGQFISLYDEPSEKFQYETPVRCYESKDFSNVETLVNYVKTPDSRMKKTMYFPINILNFGTYADGDWLSGWRIFYPSAYFRIRIIYGVYGKFKYLWTEEVKKDPNIKYPDEIERHGTTVIHTRGVGSWFSGIIDWFSNPFNQLWLLFFTLVVVVIIVSIFSPGVWTALARAFSRRRET